jgi:hypothetical protein
MKCLVQRWPRVRPKEWTFAEWPRSKARAPAGPTRWSPVDGCTCATVQHLTASMSAVGTHDFNEPRHIYRPNLVSVGHRSATAGSRRHHRPRLSARCAKRCDRFTSTAITNMGQRPDAWSVPHAGVQPHIDPAIPGEAQGRSQRRRTFSSRRFQVRILEIRAYCQRTAGLRSPSVGQTISSVPAGSSVFENTRHGSVVAVGLPASMPTISAINFIPFLRQ